MPLKRSLHTALGQVVPERGPDHIIHGFGRDTASRPALSREVGILNSPAKTAFGSLENLVPESKSSFQDEPGVSRAGAAAGRRELVRWRILCAATRVISKNGTVSADAIGFNRCRRGGGNSRRRRRRRNRGCLDDRNAVVPGECFSPSVLAAEVSVDIPF